MDNYIKLLIAINIITLLMVITTYFYTIDCIKYKFNHLINLLNLSDKIKLRCIKETELNIRKEIDNSEKRIRKDINK